MPKAMTQAMKHPYARNALHLLRDELRREPTVDEIKRKSAILELNEWIRYEVSLCLTYDRVLRRRNEILATRSGQEKECTTIVSSESATSQELLILQNQNQG
jgi:hypothetical protein